MTVSTARALVVPVLGIIVSAFALGYYTRPRLPPPPTPTHAVIVGIGDKPFAIILADDQGEQHNLRYADCVKSKPCVETMSKLLKADKVQVIVLEAIGATT